MLQTALATIVLPLTVLAIAWTDFRTLTIPNLLTGLLAAGGLAFQLQSSPQTAWVYVASALSVVAGFWMVRAVHARLSGRIGLGLGDVKMAGACALWVEPALLPLLVLVASGSALAYVASRQRIRTAVDLEVRHPFGPFLGVGLLVTFGMSQVELLSLDIGR
jgi:leader peptidase (prepilin peptidase)/N-methyltransferase